MSRSHELVALASQFRDESALTVYLRASVANPAQRNAWQVELDHALEPVLAAQAGASHDARAALDAAIARLNEWLTAEREALRAAGVVAVVSAERVLYARSTDLPVPTIARWGRGAYLAPLLRNASLGGASAVLLLDARHATLFRFVPPRRVERVEVREAASSDDFERRMGGAVGGFHMGTRGGTASDDAARLQLTERDRLFAEALSRAADVAEGDGWIVLAGTARSVAAARALLPAALEGRAISLERLDVHASEFEVAQAAAAAIQARESVRDREVVHDILEAHGARGRGVAGLSATRAMLERQGVADLVLSERFVAGHPDEADALLAQALGQGATIRQVQGDAAAEIDERAEGVAARLRYAPMAAPPAEAVG
jgi:Bacterial archaeo-eukaryotic release factor family 10